MVAEVDFEGVGRVGRAEGHFRGDKLELLLGLPLAPLWHRSLFVPLRHGIGLRRVGFLMIFALILALLLPGLANNQGIRFLVPVLLLVLPMDAEHQLLQLPHRPYLLHGHQVLVGRRGTDPIASQVPQQLAKTLAHFLLAGWLLPLSELHPGVDPNSRVLLLAVPQEDHAGGEPKEPVVVLQVVRGGEDVLALAREVVEPLSLLLGHPLQGIPCVLCVDVQVVGVGTAEGVFLGWLEVDDFGDADVVEGDALLEPGEDGGLLVLGGEGEGVFLDDFLGVAMA